jgi:hypothetical protein
MEPLEQDRQLNRKQIDSRRPWGRGANRAAAAHGCGTLWGRAVSVSMPELSRKPVMSNKTYDREARADSYRTWAARDKCGDRPYSTVHRICQVFWQDSISQVLRQSSWDGPDYSQLVGGQGQ